MQVLYMDHPWIARDQVKKDIEWKYVGIRLEPKVKRMLEKLAAKERRSINQYVTKLIEEEHAETNKARV